MSVVETQVKVIAGIEIIVCFLLLVLNIKILFQISFAPEKDVRTDFQEFPQFSVSALVAFFLVRVVYLTGEFLLAIVLNVSAHKRNYNGLFLWFIITVTIIIASRCYFIGGFTWGKYFYTTLIIFLANLIFTFYSLIAVFYYLRHLDKKANRVVQRRCSYASTNNDYVELQKIRAV